MHDPTEYPDPADFRPERFIHDGKIDTTVRDPFTIVFGSGRRYGRSSYRSLSYMNTDAPLPQDLSWEVLCK